MPGGGPGGFGPSHTFCATLPCPWYTSQYSWQIPSSQRTGLYFLFPVSTGGSPGHQLKGPSGWVPASAVPTDKPRPATAKLADISAPAMIRLRL